MISVAFSSRLDCAAQLILTVEQKRICLHEALYVGESTVARERQHNATREKGEKMFSVHFRNGRERESRTEQDIKVCWRQKSAFILTQFSLLLLFGVEKRNEKNFHFPSPK